MNHQTKSQIKTLAYGVGLQALGGIALYFSLQTPVYLASTANLLGGLLALGGIVVGINYTATGASMLLETIKHTTDSPYPIEYNELESSNNDYTQSRRHAQLRSEDYTSQKQQQSNQSHCELRSDINLQNAPINDINSNDDELQNIESIRPRIRG